MLKGKEVEEWLLGSGEAETSDTRKDEPHFTLNFHNFGHEADQAAESDLKGKHEDDDWMFQNVNKLNTAKVEEGLESYIDYMDQFINE